MAISDDRQRIMPTEADRESGKVLDYKEAVLLTNPLDSRLKGEVSNTIRGGARGCWRQLEHPPSNSFSP